MNSYRTTIHIRCPFQPVWDYYTVELYSEQMVQCEIFEECCDHVRGSEVSQETTAELIQEAVALRLPRIVFSLKVTGRHGANCETVIKL